MNVEYIESRTTEYPEGETLWDRKLVIAATPDLIVTTNSGTFAVSSFEQNGGDEAEGFVSVSGRKLLKSRSGFRSSYPEYLGLLVELPTIASLV